MGLSAPKKRAKLSHDPNNTAWSRDSNSFGRKILSSQGWTPGQTLGKQDAAHAAHYTAGSNSHIRVLLKDDNLGLGAGRGANHAETFGLSLYSGILGRLNGKTDTQLAKEQTKRRDVELSLYQTRKYGYINFVSAGFLVGDRIEDAKISKEKPEEVVQLQKKQQEEQSDSSARKRKRSEPTTSDSDSDSSSEDEKATAKKAKKSKKSRKDEDSADTPDAPKEKKTKKSKKQESAGDESDLSTSSTAQDKQTRDKKKEKKTKKRKSESTTSEDESRAEKKARKAERRARKEERRIRKEQKRAERSGNPTPSTLPATPAEVATSRSGTSTPQGTPFVGRNAARSRYIAQKRLASLNPQALKEIFMVKQQS